LVPNVIGFQGILRYKVSDQGASFTAVEQEPIVSSSDPNFRPADLEIGPDGALYFTDWHNPIIGHLQHALRDPSRDRTHGRIYRVTCEGREPLKPVKIAGAPIDTLLDVLKEPEDRVRYRARIDDPKAGWKGKAIWSDNSSVVLWHQETGEGSFSKVVKFQMRPDPLAD